MSRLLLLCLTIPALTALESLRIEDRVISPLDDRLFAHFMETCTHEIGPEAALDPATGQMRAEALALLDHMDIPLIRFPGGMAIESPGWRWTDLIDGAYGRVSGERPPATQKGVVKHHNRFGYDEFLRLCEAHNTEAMLVVKLGDLLRGFTPPGEMMDLAQSLIAYCNLPVERKQPEYLARWARLRAHNGHPEPYKVRYWQIGNEIFCTTVPTMRKRGWSDARIAEAYVTAVKEVAEALLAVDPSIEILVEINMEHPATGLAVWDQLAGRCGRLIDYVTTHEYRSWSIDRLMRAGEPIGLDGFTPADYWLAVVAAPGVDARGQAHYDPPWLRAATARGYPVALTEWNWNSWWKLPAERGEPFREPLWAKGVAAASMLHAFMSSPIDIAIATQSMLMGESWDLRSIDVAEHRCRLHPSGQVTTLYGHHHGHEVLAWEGHLSTYTHDVHIGNLPACGAVAWIDCVVSRDAETLYLHLINRSLDQPQTLLVDTTAVQQAAVVTAQAFRLHGGLDETSWTRQGQDQGATDHLHLTREVGQAWHIPLPPASVQVVELPRHLTP